MDSTTTLATAGVIGLTGLYFGKRFFEGGVCNITKDLTGQVVVVTGSNTGLGKETARVLARMGATVVLACRDTTKGAAVLDEIQKETNNKNVELIKLDLSDLKSIKEFADEFKRRHQKLNILINNAGVMTIPDRRLTKDGFEMQHGTNHVGHFYLTTQLLDVIKKAAPSRIINVSSMGHYGGKINWDDIMAEKKYNLMTQYTQSKLANVMFSKELQRRLKDDNVKAVSLHPGAVTTELTRYAKEKWYYNLIFSVFSNTVTNYFWKTPLQGAQTSLQCALEDFDKLEGGAYYSDCKVKKENSLARKEDDCKRLWEVTEKAINEKLNK